MVIKWLATEWYRERLWTSRHQPYITSYQAALLSGTLFPGEIEYPFETNDIIDTAITVKTAATQLDAGGNPITIQKIVRYRIKLV